MQGYDAWLEAPYVDAAREEERFEAFVEAHVPDLDWDDEVAVEDAQGAYESFLEDLEWGE